MFITGEVKEKESRWMQALKRKYQQILDWAYQFKMVVVTLAVSILVLTGVLTTQIGSEFAPQLSEKGFCFTTNALSSTGLEQSLECRKTLKN